MSYAVCSREMIQCSSVVRNKGAADIEAAIEDSRGLWAQIQNILRQGDCKWILLLIPCNSIVVYYLWNWSAGSESLALRGYANALAFNVCALAVCLISIWVEQNSTAAAAAAAATTAAAAGGGRRFAYSDEHRHRRHGSSAGTLCKSTARPAAAAAAGCLSHLGLEKYEVFGLLGSSCLCLFAQALLLVDALARIAQQQPVLVHEGRLGLGAVVGVVAHLVTIVVYPDAGLNHVVCKALPCPTFNGINPILAANLVSFAILCGSHLAIHFWQLYVTDIAAAFAVIALTAASMLPLAFYTVFIILQKISHHMSEQLDRCIQEALIIDGVLEFRNERFWTKSFGKLSGSLEVRIRKNADENYVLGKVIKRLSQVVSTLKVKEFREPINVANNFMMGLPFEYYMDELLQNKVSKASEKKPNNVESEDIEACNIVQIQDVLCCDGALTSSIEKQKEKLHENPAKVTNGSKNSEKPSQKYSYPKVPVRNVLLLGSRCDLEDLHCTVRLHCQ